MAEISAPVTAMRKPLLCAVALIAALSTEPLHAQQDGPNYPVLTVVFLVGAIGSIYDERKIGRTDHDRAAQGTGRSAAGFFVQRAAT
jgi:hypothetical protein